MPKAYSTAPLHGLAKCLVDHQLLDIQTAQQASQEASKAEKSLVSYIVEKQLLNPRTLASVASQAYGIPVFDLDTIKAGQLNIDAIGEQLIRKHQVLPLSKRDKRLFVAIADPTQQQSLDEIQFHTGLIISPVLVEADILQRKIDDALQSPESIISELDRETTDTAIKDAPVVRYVNKILLDAINANASDIHFEPYEKNYRIRFRQDGILRNTTPPPANIAKRLATRLKVMARLNIAEHRVPQDGRIRMPLSQHKAIDFRINTCPTLHGEKIVLRLLDPSSAQIGIDALGFDQQQKQFFLDAIQKPHGMILVTGPTGSGKTVSLYTALNLLNHPQVNIFTVEDPVEIQVPGINQVNVNLKTGLTFAAASRAFLRQDPDIIMVGEIRDLETAEIAIKAAQTGHLVLSTLHTNDASQTLARLAYMGIPTFNIASSINLIIAQRLARRLCDNCKCLEKLPQEALMAAGFTEAEAQCGINTYTATGCAACHGSGYKGRVGIFEVMPISDSMGRLIMQGADAIQIRDQAKQENIADLRTSGLGKVKAGLTSLEEVNRVTKD